MRITSNLFAVDLPFQEFDISRLPYKRDDLLALRQQYNASHSFFRTGDFIYISPMGDVELGIGDPVRLSIADNLSVVSSLIKHVFFRTFRQRHPEIVPQSFYPFRILSRRNEDDMVSGMLPDDLRGVLSRKKQIEVQFRDVSLEGHLIFGALINLRYRWTFAKPCLDLIAEGFEVQGRQALVSEELPGLRGIIAPDESLVGRIVAFDATHAQVETNDGTEEYSLSDLYLHKSTDSIRDYLKFRIGDLRANRIIELVKAKDQTRLDAKYYHGEVLRMASRLSQLEYRNRDNFTFAISKEPTEVNESYRLHAPAFLFDYNPGAADEDPSRGLIHHGPYDASTFEPKTPRILAVFHRSNRGGFTTFLGKLKSGIASSSSFKGGLKGKYQLHDVVFDTVELQDYTMAEYAEKIATYIGGQDFLPDLAIIETRDEFRNLPPEKNPYYRTKAYLLSLGVPVQFITNGNVRKEDRYLQWICESVALQIYAKLGGRPWVLPASGSIDHEIVVGIGSSMLRKNMFAGAIQQRIVGITTFFTGDGKYIQGNRCKDVPFEQYFDELLSRLRTSIRDISQEYGWQANSTVRIVFHIFKPIRNIEADVVEAVLREFQQYKIHYCFVTISDHHPFLLFDKHQGGVGANAKGKYVPERGVNWVLGSHTCLLQLKGPRDIKSAHHGFSNPVLVRIHEKSTFADLNTIAQQIFNFTYLSWRGFHPVQQPVTILYSDLIAKHLSNMRRINSWKPELINSLLRTKKWFL